MYSNTSSEDINAIKSLQERKDIVIKPADKGGAIVVVVVVVESPQAPEDDSQQR